MQTVDVGSLRAPVVRPQPSPEPAGRLGTIPVTLRLDPPRYDRFKRLVHRLSTTGQSILQTALDRRMMALERQPVTLPMVAGQSSLFEPVATSSSHRRPSQPSLPFERPEPTVATGYRASIPMHRWLQRRSHESGRTIRDLIDEALKAAGGPSGH